MSTLAVALAKIAVLEARLDALEGGGGRPSSSGGGGSSSEGEALPDHMLDNAWANEKIAKDPKQWKGPTQVNRTLSRAPVEWLNMAAHNLEYKADCERKATPVALQERGKNAGKPWHEATTFKAKLMRAWAKRNAAKASSSPKADAAPPAPVDDFDFGGAATGSDDEIPF